MSLLVHVSRVRTSLDSSRAEFHPALNEEFPSYLFSQWLSASQDKFHLCSTLLPAWEYPERRCLYNSSIENCYLNYYYYYYYYFIITIITIILINNFLL